MSRFQKAAIARGAQPSPRLLLELLSQDSSLGLPLGQEAPVMTPNGVIFLFFSFSFYITPVRTSAWT